MKQSEIQQLVYCDKIAANELVGDERDNKPSEDLYPVLDYIIDGKSIAQLVDEAYFTSVDEVIKVLNHDVCSVSEQP